MDKALLALGCILTVFGFVRAAILCRARLWHAMITVNGSIIIGTIGVLVMVIATNWSSSNSAAQRSPLYAHHEQDSQQRYEVAQSWLNGYFPLNIKKDDEGLKKFAAIFDAQQKLEDFLIKSRAAEHASLQFWWSTVFAGLVVTVIGGLLTWFGTKHSS
jgi:hypothetical protein